MAVAAPPACSERRTSTTSSDRYTSHVWLRSPSFRGLTEAYMWQHLAEGLLPAYDQPQPGETTVDQSVAPPANNLARAGVREVWKARRSADSVRLELLAPEAARLLHDVCRDAALALPFGDQTHGRAVIRVTVEHSEEREDPPSTPHQGVLPLALSKHFFRCALTTIAIYIGRLANLELPAVEQLAEVIAATIAQRINTPPELQHAQWLTYTMMTVGIEMQQYHDTEPKLLRVGDDNLCAISLGKEADEEFADTLRLAVALTSPVALLWAVRLRTIVIYFMESEFDPLELLIHPFSQTVREAGELGGNTSHNQLRRTAMGLRKGKAAASAKHKKKQPTGRSHSGGATRTCGRSKPRVSGTRDSDSEWEPDDETPQPSGSSHQ
eukprot:jgi/Tetstr1/436586/TSEL_025383.t1